MTAIYVIGWIGVVAAGAVIVTGLRALLGEIAFRARWKWGDAHQMKRSVQLGWNTGEPPEGVWVLVREYAEKRTRLESDLRNNEWAVMMRDGDWCYTADGGLTTPITNITGWLLLEQPNA